MAPYNIGVLPAHWFGICIDFLVSVFVSIVAFAVVLQYEAWTVGEAGLCLVCAVQLSRFFAWIMRQSAELENGTPAMNTTMRRFGIRYSKDKGLNVEFDQCGVSSFVGQRQLFCLACAMIHSCKIIVVNEPPANVDGVTDACIQKTIRNHLKSSTIITVAHRLYTIINSGKIMVFKKGKLLEFDKPSTLLINPASFFSKMAAPAGADHFVSLGLFH